MMKRILVLSCTILLFSGVSGCSSDSRDVQVNKAINVLELASTKLANVRAEVEKASKKAKETGGEIKAKDLDEAVKSADELEKLAKSMQAINGDVDALKDTITKEEREDLKKKYQGRLEQVVKRVDEEQKSLDASIREAENLNINVNKDALEPLRKKMEKLNGEFQNLSKRR
jgi:hypothetical protein